MNEKEKKAKEEQALQEKIQIAHQEIMAILDKYGLDMITIPMIQIIKKQEDDK